MIKSKAANFSSEFSSNDWQAFAKIRQLEALGFRGFPAGATHFNGTWAIRLTAGHPAKRLNSVTPLDPNDGLDVPARLGIIERQFSSYGRQSVFRLTPLTPFSVIDHFVANRWQCFDKSLVMQAELAKIGLDDAVVQLPTKDIGFWIDHYLKISNTTNQIKPGFAEIIGRTLPLTGLFLTLADQEHNKSGKALSLLRCVCDHEFAGIFDLVSVRAQRRQGHATRLIKSALLWAQRQGAKKAFLQVEAQNQSAVQLYRSMGFETIYHYDYWQRENPDN